MDCDITLQIPLEIQELADRAQADVAAWFLGIDAVAECNTRKVLEAFRKHRVSEACFAGTTGYGYDDLGRETLERVWADVFGTESALVRLGFVNGTHAIAAALFGVLRPGDTLVSAVGAPYDTMRTVISGTRNGSLKDFGVQYREVPTLPDGAPDETALREAVRDGSVRAVLIQRSRGYAERPSLSVEAIGRLCAAVKEENPAAAVLVDNCYGEFVEDREPSEVGADLVMGSLIKNPGGGLAPMGGYVAGRSDLVEAAAMRLTAPGIGRECGATLGENRLLFQGFFLAPHTVAQALKTAVFAARLMELLGYDTRPASSEARTDIVQMISFGNPEAVRRFCKGIQMGACVDSFVTPEPWRMPGYDCEVIMAAGAFIQGSSIELSADAPMRPPYACYLQGALTYEAGKTGVLLAASQLLGL